MADLRVPFLDLQAAYKELRNELDDAYQRVMRSGRYLLGDELSDFEESFAEFSGAKYCIGVASGLDALILALRACDIGQGDEVIVPTNTFIATWLAVSAVGAKLVPIDPNPTTYCVDGSGITNAITEKTAAIIPVHLYGLPADMREIERVAVDADVTVIADAAQSHGATLHGASVGSYGDVSAWSFYPGKNLGAFADAGAITTDSEDLLFKVRNLRNYGSEEKYVHSERGLNSRLDELQAAFLRAKLVVLEEWNSRRVHVAERYLAELAELPITLPSAPADRTSSWHLFVIRSTERDRLQRHLAEAGIETLVHYPIPCHRQSAYADTFAESSGFPVADDLARSILSLPIGPHLSDDGVDLVVSAIKSYF
jgi:dTDP-4-amino-4,6-dideoxygalactose transaminase